MIENTKKTKDALNEINSIPYHRDDDKAMVSIVKDILFSLLTCDEINAHEFHQKLIRHPEALRFESKMMLTGYDFDGTLWNQAIKREKSIFLNIMLQTLPEKERGHWIFERPQATHRGCQLMEKIVDFAISADILSLIPDIRHHVGQLERGGFYPIERLFLNSGKGLKNKNLNWWGEDEENLLRKLLEYGANPNAGWEEGRSAFHRLIGDMALFMENGSFDFDMGQMPGSGRNIVQMCENHFNQAAKILMKYGFDLKRMPEPGKSLFESIRLPKHEWQTVYWDRVATFLLANGAVLPEQWESRLPSVVEHRNLHAIAKEGREKSIRQVESSYGQENPKRLRRQRMT